MTHFEDVIFENGASWAGDFSGINFFRALIFKRSCDLKVLKISGYT